MRLAVFDCDGTLVDSQSNIALAIGDSFSRLGLTPPSRAAIRHIVGLSVEEAVAALAPGLVADEQLQLAHEYRQAFRRLRESRRLQPEPLFPGIRSLLERLAGSGWQMAIATGKSDRGLSFVLDQHDLRPFFHSLQTADHHPSKPDPAMLNQCLLETGVAAADAFIIGDTSYDIAMGVAAGVPALGVSWGYHGAGALAAAGACGIADSSDDLWELLHG